MNKPTRIDPKSIGEDIGPLDEHGQQIWSPEEEAAIERLRRDPAYQAAIEEAEEDIRQGRTYSHEQVIAHCAERRARYLAMRAK